MKQLSIFVKVFILSIKYNEILYFVFNITKHSLKK